MADREKQILTIALPKGRLEKQTIELFGLCGIVFTIDGRQLIAESTSHALRLILVKNTDLPTYVSHGIAALGVCGADVVYESRLSFLSLLHLPFGETKMCLAGKRGAAPIAESSQATVASKFTRFARDHFHGRGLPVDVIKLNGSVELAPVLGLAPYIVDLVETGNTLKAHDLVVIEELASIDVNLIANPANYKIHYRRIDELVKQMRRGVAKWIERA